MDEDGIPVSLRGCNLGNWFLLEMWMLDMNEFTDQYEFEKTLESRFGEQEKNRLMEIYRTHWITERDFDLIATSGLNVVRIPFHYSLLEDDRHPMVMKENGLAWLDRAVEMAAKRNLYVILDLHGVQGGQSTDHTTGRAGMNKLWSDKTSQERCIWLWRELAAHYRNNSTVMAYDVINEPFGEYKKKDEHEPVLANLFGKIYDAIREKDARHIILIPGTHSGVEFYGDPREKGWKQIGFTEHFYPGLFGEPANIESHVQFIQHKLPWRVRYFKELNTPFLVGEFQTVFRRLGGGALMRYYYDLYNHYGWAATMWSYKILKRSGGEKDNSWGIVSNLKPMPLVNMTDSTKEEIEQLFEWFGTMKYVENQNLLSAIQAEFPPPLELPELTPLLMEAPQTDALPPGWTSENIGRRARGGQELIAPDVLNLYGAGEDIWETDDSFYFLSRPANANAALSATLHSVSETHRHAKAGLMLRSSSESDAAHLLIAVFPDGLVSIGWRAEKEKVMKQINLKELTFPIRLTLQRKGGLAQVSCSSSDGKNITRKFKLSADFSGPCRLGFAACSHDVHYFTEAPFTNIRWMP